MIRVLILGASGTIGNTMLRIFSELPEFNVCGTARSPEIKSYFTTEIADKLIFNVDAQNFNTIMQVVTEFKPDFLVNCIGLVKQIAYSNDPTLVMPVNAIFPHQLAKLCKLSDSKLIHFSTDCVFSGRKGNYIETDPMDINDLYGMSKFIGEVNSQHTLTLRTSFIGHELATKHELVEWFLSQEGTVKGFKNAIYSGLPTVFLASLVRDIILKHPDLNGLYHVASNPISKFDLLTLIANIYDKDIQIIPDHAIEIDRSLNAQRLKNVMGYTIPNWHELIKQMHSYR
ncbi:dTDP-4-dehydrorhamnose reductase family protein [Lentilitoribacter sp. EG35]|uniref:dTDP-4-dehydrorhamnose reductase family protein n=1 Tax=Lentilitoribacter sp. EG35 TaxID=3234192 RepID=UPI0034601B93